MLGLRMSYFMSILLMSSKIYVKYFLSLRRSTSLIRCTTLSYSASLCYRLYYVLFDLLEYSDYCFYAYFCYFYCFYAYFCDGYCFSAYFCDGYCFSAYFCDGYCFSTYFCVDGVSELDYSLSLNFFGFFYLYYGSILLYIIINTNNSKILYNNIIHAEINTVKFMLVRL